MAGHDPERRITKKIVLTADEEGQYPGYHAVLVIREQVENISTTTEFVLRSFVSPQPDDLTIMERKVRQAISYVDQLGVLLDIEIDLSAAGIDPDDAPDV